MSDSTSGRARQPATHKITVLAPEAAALRTLAGELGYHIPKGPGAGELGNTRALLAALAAAYRADPTHVRRAVGALVHALAPE